MIANDVVQTIGDVEENTRGLKNPVGDRVRRMILSAILAIVLFANGRAQQFVLPGDNPDSSLW
jgi:hypothetical protein